MAEIHAKADAYIKAYDDEGTEWGAYVTGATEYATNAYAALALLEKFISRHEAGLLPDRFIYNEIKTFLDGTK